MDNRAIENNIVAGMCFVRMTATIIVKKIIRFLCRMAHLMCILSSKFR